MSPDPPRGSRLQYQSPNQAIQSHPQSPSYENPQSQSLVQFQQSSFLQSSAYENQQSQSLNQLQQSSIKQLASYGHQQDQWSGQDQQSMFQQNPITAGVFRGSTGLNDLMASSPQPSFPHLHIAGGYNPSYGRLDSASGPQTPTVSSYDSSNQQNSVSNPQNLVAIFARTFQRTIASIANAVRRPDLDAPSTPSPATASQDIVQMYDPQIIQTVRTNADLNSVPPEITYPESISAE